MPLPLLPTHLTLTTETATKTMEVGRNPRTTVTMTHTLLRAISSLTTTQASTRRMPTSQETIMRTNTATSQSMITPRPHPTFTTSLNQRPRPTSITTPAGNTMVPVTITKVITGATITGTGAGFHQRSQRWSTITIITTTVAATYPIISKNINTLDPVTLILSPPYSLSALLSLSELVSVT